MSDESSARYFNSVGWLASLELYADCEVDAAISGSDL